MSASPATLRRTFLFTDIESSTRLWDHFPDAMLAALDQHDQLLRSAVELQGGSIIRHTGDGVIAVFGGVGGAVAAALAAQRGFAVHLWEDVDPLRVRMGVHTGDIVLRDGEHHGWALNVASRLHALAHGGQIVVSGAAMSELHGGDVPGATFVDLGLHHLRDVAEPVRVYTVAAAGIGPPFEGLRDAARRVASLPRPLTPFIGRGLDIERVEAELGRHLVVTLAGTSGIGKTRLAVEVAWRVAGRFRDGVVMCELGGVAGSEVGAALARALGVERRSMRSAEESVVEWLRDRNLLLVLDGCEHAGDEVRTLVGAISQDARSCVVLATSHEPLAVDGEQVVRVRPLHVDGDHSDGVELFLARAAGAGAEFVDDARARSLARSVCEVVDGLPLAIEIAASSAGSLSLLDILDAVRAGELPARSGGSDRRSVVDALELTFGRLDDEVRAAFLRCAVFSGSFDRVAFAEIAAPELDGPEVLASLRVLVDRSLITAETRRERTRFRLLEPVRAFAERRCDPVRMESAQAAFLTHYVGRAETASASLRGPEEARWVSQIELDFDNLRAAHRRALTVASADVSLRIVAALWDFGFMRMRSEIFDWGEAAVAAGGDLSLCPMVMGVVALGGWLRENPGKATAFGAEAIRLERESLTAPSIPARLALMNAAEYGGEPVDVRSLMAEVTDAAHRSASTYWQVNVNVLRTLSYSFAGRIEQAERMAEAAMLNARRSENPSTIAWALFASGMAIEGRDAEAAEALFGDALDRSRSVENGWIGAMCGTRLASLRRRRGAWPDAMQLVAQLLDVWDRAGHRSHLWGAVRQAALCLAEAGDHEHAVLLHDAAGLARLQAPALPGESMNDRACIQRAVATLADGDRRRLAVTGAGLGEGVAMRLASERMAAFSR
jgi:predicted ATPase/class 3 adenylate cyclase